MQATSRPLRAPKPPRGSSWDRANDIYGHYSVRKFNPIDLHGLDASLVEADLDGNGASDVIGVTIVDNAVAIHLKDGTGKVLPQSLPFGVAGGGLAVAAADFNGDGAVDLAVAFQRMMQWGILVFLAR